MGWFDSDAPGHEGYLVALVREEGAGREWRDLRVHPADEAGMRKHDGCRIEVVQVACDCGWRSPRIHAPLGTTWRPCMVVLPAGAGVEAEFERFALELWQAHMREAFAIEARDGVALCRRDPQGRYYFAERA